MHFLGPGLTDHFDNFSAGGTADQGIIHHDHSLAVQDFLNGIKFNLDAEVPN